MEDFITQYAPFGSHSTVPFHVPLIPHVNTADTILLSDDPAILYPSAQVAVVVVPTIAFPSGERVPFRRVGL